MLCKVASLLYCYEIRYVEKVLEVDAEDDTLRISFMENCVKLCKMEGRFSWPQPEDKLWIHKSDVLKWIGEPIAMGKLAESFG